jgi:hypothetical protein
MPSDGPSSISEADSIPPSLNLVSFIFSWLTDQTGYGRTTLLLNRSPTTEHHDQPLFTVGDAEELEHQERVVLGTREEGSREVGGVGNRIH